MTQIIKDEGVDLVLIAGDVFDHQAPTASSEEIVYKALLDFAATGAKVVTTGVMAFLIVSTAWLVYVTGGARLSYSHLMYVPVVLAGIAFGVSSRPAPASAS